MKNKLFIILAFLILCVKSYAENTESPIQEYLFEPDITYPVYTALGVVTQIELSPKEKIKDFSTGLSNGWNLVRRDNVFYIKPKDVSVDTNLIVRTQAHQYIFELKVIDSDWKTLSDIKAKGVNYHIKFKYPNSTEFNVSPAMATGYSVHYDPSRSYNTNYDVAAKPDSEWLIPLKVYDDKNFTYIILQNNKFTGGFPTVYGKKSINDEEFILNTNVENNMIIIHGTYPILVLRHGNNVVGLRRN